MWHGGDWHGGSENPAVLRSGVVDLSADSACGWRIAIRGERLGGELYSRLRWTDKTRDVQLAGGVGVRCVLLVKRFWPATGGVERYTTELARALVAHRHEVTVVTGSHVAALGPRDVVNGATVHRFSALRSPLRCRWELARLRGEFACADVVHVSDVEMLDYFWRMLGPLVSPKRLCLTIHGMSCVHPVPRYEIERARRATGLVDAVIHDGVFIAKWLELAPAVIAPQGLRPTATEIPDLPEPAEPSAIYLGRLEPDTGVELYFDALAVLRERFGVTLPMHVYGEGSLHRVLAERAEAQDLRVRFCGNVADAQENITRHTLALVSGRMAIHEALARKRPVVAALTNPIRADYVREEAFSPFIATGGSGEELAAHMQRLLADADERAQIAERGWQHVRELSWERTANAYLRLWTECEPAVGRRMSWWQRLRFSQQLGREARSGKVQRRASECRLATARTEKLEAVCH